MFRRSAPAALSLPPPRPSPHTLPPPPSPQTSNLSLFCGARRSGKGTPVEGARWPGGGGRGATPAGTLVTKHQGATLAAVPAVALVEDRLTWLALPPGACAGGKFGTDPVGGAVATGTVLACGNAIV
jgi:hypothetical protein